MLLESFIVTVSTQICETLGANGLHIIHLLIRLTSSASMEIYTDDPYQSSHRGVSNHLCTVVRNDKHTLPLTKSQFTAAKHVLDAHFCFDRAAHLHCAFIRALLQHATRQKVLPPFDCTWSPYASVL
jgi:hypothetical protein